MLRVAKNRFLHFAAAALGLFLILLYLLPTNRLIELMNSVFIFVVVAFAIVLAPGLWRAITQRSFDRLSQASVGIACLLASITVSRLGNVMGRVVGSFDTVADSPLIAVAVYLAILGSVLLVTAPGMVDGKWRYNKGLVLAAIGCGLITAGAVYTMQIQVLQ